MTSRDLLSMVAAVSVKTRSYNRDATMASITEELGELATEIAIENGWKNREAGPDGVVGEGIDLLICVVDLLHMHLGHHLESEEFLDKVQLKLDKWERKCSE